MFPYAKNFWQLWSCGIWYQTFISVFSYQCFHMQRTFGSCGLVVFDTRHLYHYFYMRLSSVFSLANNYWQLLLWYVIPDALIGIISIYMRKSSIFCYASICSHYYAIMNCGYTSDSYCVIIPREHRLNGLVPVFSVWIWDVSDNQPWPVCIW